MNIGIVSKYNKIHCGNCNIPSSFIKNKYILLYELEEIGTLKELIDLYRNCLKNYKNNFPVMLAIIKNKYTIDNILFCNINFNFCNFITKIKHRYRLNRNLNNKWNIKFRQIRGRYPNYYDNSLLY